MAWAPLVGRRRAVVVLNRGEHTAIYACDALTDARTMQAGAVAWQRELLLANPGPPAESRGRVWLGGARDNEAVIVALTSRGRPVWEKVVPLEPRSLRLLPFEGGVLVTDARGAALRLLPDGAVAWVLGAPGDELLSPIDPALRRRTLVVPGPLTRLVDPLGGRVLAELPTGPRVLDLKADARLNLYLLREPGTLETYAPGAALAVVPSAR